MVDEGDNFDQCYEGQDVYGYVGWYEEFEEFWVVFEQVVNQNCQLDYYGQCGCNDDV